MNNEVEKSLITAKRCDEEAPEKFLVAWKQGVNKVGHQYFDIDASVSVDEAISREALKPNIEAISRNFGVLSRGEQALIALMCAFYCPAEGQKLLDRTFQSSFVEAIAVMDWTCQKNYADLCAYYTRWKDGER